MKGSGWYLNYYFLFVFFFLSAFKVIVRGSRTRNTCLKKTPITEKYYNSETILIDILYLHNLKFVPLKALLQ